jgi:hypothetical protein
MVDSTPYMSIFFALLIIGILTMVIAYKHCKKLKLNPPVPVIQSEQFKFFSFIGKKSKEEQYKSLRPYYIAIIVIQVLLVIVLYLAFIS